MKNTAVGNSGGGIHFNTNCGGFVSHCIITGNSTLLDMGGRGGGISVKSSNSILVTNCTIADNAAGYGGGIHLEDSNNIIRNSMITDNSATYGGGIYIKQPCYPEVRNCTMTANAADYGGGIYATGTNDMVVSNAIFWNDDATEGPEIWLDAGSDMTISYSDLAGGQTSIYIDPDSTLTWGPGMIDQEPLFVEPDGPDDDPFTWEDNDYHLWRGSPCIDTGNPDFEPDPGETDIDGDPRIFNDRVDMGADEYTESLIY